MGSGASVFFTFGIALIIIILVMLFFLLLFQ